MKKDQIKGNAQDLADKGQEAAAQDLDSQEIQSKSFQKQMQGNAEKAIGEAREGVKNVTDAVKRATKTR